MSERGSTIGIPIWVRVPGIIVAVLIGVVASAMLLGAAGVGGGAGPNKHGPVQRPNQQQIDPGHDGGHRPPKGAH
jgi:hypothetical protein